MEETLLFSDPTTVLFDWPQASGLDMAQNRSSSLRKVSKHFYMSMTESLQNENYGGAQSPRKSHAGDSFNQCQPHRGLLWAKPQTLPKLLLFCTSNLAFIRQSEKIYYHLGGQNKQDIIISGMETFPSTSSSVCWFTSTRIAAQPSSDLCLYISNY